MNTATPVSDIAKKKPAQLTPKSLALLRADGWTVAVVEHWNSFVRQRRDLFGIFDLLSVGREGTLAVQVCRRADIATRAKKIAASDNIGPVRDAGWKVEIHGWDKVDNRWRVKRVDIS